MRALAWPVLALAACGPAEDGTGAFDPHAAPLVFSSDRDGTSRVFVRAGDGASWRPLSPRGVGSGWPVPSPDAEEILFQGRRDGTFDVYRVGSDGSGLRPLTDEVAHDYLPSWAPDGQVTFVSQRLIPPDTVPDAWLWIMEGDGSGQRRLVADGLGVASAATWAPDGSYFLASRVVEGRTELWRAAPDGTWLGAVADSAEAPSFSPDGAWLAVHVEGGGGSRIDVLRPDGSQRRTVLGGGWHFYPRWSPDGRWLLTCSAADASRADLDVLLLPADGSEPPVTLVGGPGRECEASWLAERPWTT